MYTNSDIARISLAVYKNFSALLGCSWRRPSSICAPTVLVVFSLLVGSVYAQTAATGALTGKVTDSTGAIIQGAAVTVTSVATGAVRKTATDANGNYTEPLLPPGLYRVEFSKDQFKTLAYGAIVVNITETAILHARLQIGAITEKVTVESTAEQLETQTTALGHVIPERQIEALPLVTRNYTDIIGLSPGVNKEANNAGTLGRGTGGLTGGTGGEGMEVHGAPSYDTNFQMNGVGINDAIAGGAVSGGVAIPNPDTLQEFKVQTGQYDAAFGRGAGANVNVVTKGGTNDFHGTLFEFFRNEALNANEYFRKQQGQPRGILRQNQFGFTFGGPIKKDTLFFFLSYQGTRQLNGIDSQCSSTVLGPPLTNDRSRAGLGAIFGGMTGLLGPGAGGANTIANDGSNISDQALAVLNLKLPDGSYVIPTPQNPSGSSAFSLPCTFNENQFMTNADYQMSAKSRFAVRFFSVNSDQSLTLPATNLTGPSIPGFPVSGPSRYRNFTLSHSYIFNGHLINEATLGFHRILSRNDQKAPFSWQDVGVSATPYTIVPNIDVIGNFAAGGQGQSQDMAQNTYSFVDTLSYVHGRHNLRLGGGVTRSQQNLFNFNFSGALIFFSFPDFLLGTDGVTNGTGLSNLFGSAALSGLFTREWRTWDGNAFVQDDITVTSRLTLNLGFRYERLGDIGEELGRNSGFDMAAADPNPPDAGSLAGFTVPSNFRGTVPEGVTRASNDLGIRGDGQNTFSPRIGFAWQLPYTQRFVLRGGYGTFYSRLPAVPVLQGISGEPWGLLQFPQLDPTLTFASPFPPAPTSFPQFVPYSPTTALSPFVLAQNYRPTMVQQYSLNLQSQIGTNFLLEAGYVGTRSTHVITARLANQALFASPSNPIRGQTDNTVENIPLRLPIEGFAPSGFRQIETSDYGWYNGLEVSVRKRFNKGLQFLASYTFSRALAVDGANVTGTTGGQFNAVGNQNDPRSRYGLSSFNRPHRFVVSYGYEFPHPANLSSFKGKLLAGWQLSGVATIQAGQPLTVRNEETIGNVFGITDDRAQLAPGCTNSQVETKGSVTGKLTNYFNTTCVGPSFQPPPIGDGIGFGNSGVGIVRGPDQRNFDLAIVKKTSMGWPRDGANIEFRTEFFNAFNTPQFNNPDPDISSASFGQVTTTAVNPRIIQFALKLNF